MVEDAKAQRPLLASAVRAFPCVYILDLTHQLEGYPSAWDVAFLADLADAVGERATCAFGELVDHALQDAISLWSIILVQDVA